MSERYADHITAFSERRKFYGIRSALFYRFRSYDTWHISRRRRTYQFTSNATDGDAGALRNWGE